MRDDALVGFCALSFRNSLWQAGYIGHIDELVIDDACRGQGVGAEMLAVAEEMARARGCRVIGLESLAHRTRAHAFYERHGYDKCSVFFTKPL